MLTLIQYNMKDGNFDLRATIRWIWKISSDLRTSMDVANGPEYCKC